ncbi:MAG: DUF2067 domain-containing protein [Asgard group archaeon]|nr:DUF2067 domain-containing protein [Asgard group archaeon]
MVKLLVTRWPSKEIVLGISSTQEAIIFLEAIQKQIKIVDIVANYFPGKVTIRFEGAKENLKDALDMARNIHQLVKGMLYPDDDEYYSYDITFLSKVTGKTFPMKTLLRILQLQNYKTTRENGTLVSQINFDSLSNLIYSIDKVYNEMPYEVATSSLRDVLTILVIFKKINIDKAISIAKKQKVISEDELNRLKLAVEPDQAVEKCL